jgi:hypothetical protein
VFWGVHFEVSRQHRSTNLRGLFIYYGVDASKFSFKVVYFTPTKNVLGV